MHNPKNPSCFHRLRILFFSRLLALLFHALNWQLATSLTSPAVSALSYHFPFNNSTFADLSVLYFRSPSLYSHLAFSFLFRRLALRFHDFEFQLATSRAGSALIYHFPFHNSIFADLQFRHSIIVFAYRSIFRRLSLFHYGIRPSPSL